MKTITINHELYTRAVSLQKSISKQYAALEIKIKQPTSEVKSYDASLLILSLHMCEKALAILSDIVEDEERIIPEWQWQYADHISRSEYKAAECVRIAAEQEAIAEDQQEEEEEAPLRGDAMVHHLPE